MRGFLLLTLHPTPAPWWEAPSKGKARDGLVVLGGSARWFRALLSFDLRCRWLPLVHHTSHTHHTPDTHAATGHQHTRLDENPICHADDGNLVILSIIGGLSNHGMEPRSPWSYHPSDCQNVTTSSTFGRLAGVPEVRGMSRERRRK